MNINFISIALAVFFNLCTNLSIAETVCIDSTPPQPNEPLNGLCRGEDSSTINSIADSPKVAADERMDLFGSVTFAGPKRKAGIFGNWSDIQKFGLELCCKNDRAKEMFQTNFEEELERASNLPFLKKLNFVNDLVNKKIDYYREKDDYWSPPSQTIARGNGDCEDFAVLKMAILKKLGVPLEQMALLIVKRKESGKLDHAVLAVYGENKNFILDNIVRKNKDGILTDEEIKNYKPVISIRKEKGKDWGLKLHGFKIKD